MTAYDLEAREDAAAELAPVSQGGSGQEITLTTLQTGVFDPATDMTTPDATITQDTSGCVFEYTTFIRAGVRNEPGSTFLAGDKQLLLSPYRLDGTPLDPPPGINDRVTLADGSKFTIMSRAPLSPAGTPIYFDCNIRGAA